MYQRSDRYLALGPLFIHALKLWIYSYYKVFPITLLISLFSFFTLYAIHSDNVHLTPSTTALLGIICFLIIALLQACLFKVYDNLSEQQSTHYSGAIKAAWHKALPVLGAAIIVYIVNFVGMLFLFIPGLIIGVYSYLTLTNVILKQQSPIQAFKHSCYLVHGHWWQTVLIILLPGLILSYPSELIQQGTRLHLALAFVIMLVITPWLTAAIYSQYRNLLQKPVDPNYETPYFTLLINRPKPLKVALIALIIYAVLIMGAMLIKVLPQVIEHSDSLVTAFVALTHQLSAPSSLLFLPVIFCTYAYFGSNVARWIWLALSVLSILMFALLLADPKIAQLTDNGIRLETQIIMILSMLLNLAIAISLCRCNVRHWFAAHKKLTIERNARAHSQNTE